MSTGSLLNSNQTLPYYDLCEQIIDDASGTLSVVLADSDLSGVFNPDVLGYGVRLSNFVINVCAGILIQWGGPEDSHDAIQSTLFQTGGIVLCTLISLVRGQLTFFDEYFTLIVVHSPIAWYMVWKSVRGIYPWNCSRGKAFPLDAVSCLVLVCGWVSLHLIVWSLTSANPVLVALAISDSLTYSVLWVRYAAFYRRRSRTSRWKRRFLLVHLIFKHHTWLIYVTVLFSYIDWSSALDVTQVEPGYIASHMASLYLSSQPSQVFGPFSNCSPSSISQSGRLGKSIVLASAHSLIRHSYFSSSGAAPGRGR
ncbi:hypothetical protein B0H14DRAFT_2836146 [Mycena olivaceomarginata]|nr:hypothetical protein B0H14DRAFT_2836146 [Mycena olivaceomarginata]